MIKTILSIAGFDGSAGAGLLADVKTAAALGCYGTAIMTALTAQNTQVVRACYDLPTESLQNQLQAIFDDIPPHAIKIGMLSSASVIETVASFLKEEAHSIPIVVDPVMISKSGHWLLEKDAITALKEKLFPLATVLTPNLFEAERLCECTGQEKSVLVEKLLAQGPSSVFLKGGHPSVEQKEDECTDMWANSKGHMQCWSLSRISTTNTHGTGCTLSAAIACFLAKGEAIAEACYQAKIYLYRCLKDADRLNIGKGYGPVHHFERFW